MGVIPYVIAEVRDAAGRPIYRRAVARSRSVIDPGGRVAMMNGMMRETLLTGTGRKAEIPGWEAAARTGTSQDFRDAWFVGYTGTLVTAVWLGNDEGTPIEEGLGRQPAGRGLEPLHGRRPWPARRPWPCRWAPAAGGRPVPAWPTRTVRAL